MGIEMPTVPSRSGEHPIALVVIAANNLAAAGVFYSNLFGWQVLQMSAELAGVSAAGGPTAALWSNVPAGFPGMVPYIRIPDVDAMLPRLVAAGAMVERAPWNVPGVGRLARFTDPSGTVYGLTDALTPGGHPSVPMPIGSNPKPPDGSICHVEIYADDGATAAQFFGEMFGWGALATMPQYMAFDPGAGVGGIFQSHTPTLPAVAYIYTTDVEAKLAEIEQSGGKRTAEPMRMPGVACFGYFKDPSDTDMGLIGP